jgi:hypothetical protein
MTTVEKEKKVVKTKRKPLRGKSYNMPERYVPNADVPPMSNTVDYVQEKESLLKAMLSENKHVRAEIERKLKSSAPICNKGAYMYIGASDDLTAIGRKK